MSGNFQRSENANKYSLRSKQKTQLDSSIAATSEEIGQNSNLLPTIKNLDEQVVIDSDSDTVIDLTINQFNNSIQLEPHSSNNNCNKKLIFFDPNNIQSIFSQKFESLPSVNLENIAYKTIKLSPQFSNIKINIDSNLLFKQSKQLNNNSNLNQTFIEDYHSDLNDSYNSSEFSDFEEMSKFDPRIIFKSIPEFDGTSKDSSLLHRFISLTDSFIEASDIDTNPKRDLEIQEILRIVRTKLSGKAYNLLKYNSYDSWENLKKDLKFNFSILRSKDDILMELINCRQSDKQDVRTFADLVENLLSDLNDVCIENEGDEMIKCIQSMNSSTALQSFVRGLKDPIKIYVKASNPTNLKEAIKKAVQEEISYTDSSISNNQFKSSPKVNDLIKCQYCKKNGHSADNCFSILNKFNNLNIKPNATNYNKNDNGKSQLNSTFTNNNSNFTPNFNSTFNNNSKFSNSNFNPYNSNNYNPNLMRANVHQMAEFCNYCKEFNHNISVCNKRMRSEARKMQMQLTSSDQNIQQNLSSSENSLPSEQI